MNKKCTAYSKMWFLALLLITFVAGCASNAQEIPVIPDTVAPTVSFTAPANGAVAVATNRKVSVAFSEAMNPSTITKDTFLVTDSSGVSVPGTVSPFGTTAVFTPSSNLAVNTLYTVTVSNGVEDLAGNTMLTDYVFTFTTAAVTDSTRPTVIDTVNADNAVNVATNTKVGATFSEVMDPLTITSTTFKLTQGVNNVAGVVTYSGTNAVFTPSNTLAAGTKYTATITTGAKDLAGNALLSNYVWSWTTAAAADTTRPTVNLVNPANQATNVVISSAVNATFSEAMDPLTISTETFTLKNGVSPVAGTVEYVALSKIATFKPTTNLATGTLYTATITTVASDLAGNTLAVDYVWSFTTDNVVVPPPVALINLGSVSSFGIMATSAITNTGAATMVNGDVSLDPGTSNGLLPVQVNGTIHINDTVSAQARIDLLAAYNSAKALAPGVTVPAGMDLGAFPNGGLPGVLPPGTYTSGSTMLVSTPLTLDGKGNPNASWVFQIGSSLTTTNSVSLTNGAQAKNVYWVPTASATVGVGTIFNGNIIAGVSATGQTGAVINGRILAGATSPGTIALDTNTVNVPQ